MKIYTKTGDKGKTSLFSGERVLKNHHRLTACGDVDELNAVIGALIVALPQPAGQIHSQLQWLQTTLFQVGALLATTTNSERLTRLEPFTTEHTRIIEQQIDSLEADLPPLTGFIVPGGGMSAAIAHIARTVCRRTERSVVGLIQGLESDGQAPDAALSIILSFLNRLSDYFFVVARHCNAVCGIGETLWQKLGS